MSSLRPEPGAVLALSNMSAPWAWLIRPFRRLGYQAARGDFVNRARPGQQPARHLALAMDQIEPGGDHNRAADQGPSGGHVAEHQIAERDGPDDLRVDERRQHRGGRPPVGQRSADNGRPIRSAPIATIRPMSSHDSGACPDERQQRRHRHARQPGWHRTASSRWNRCATPCGWRCHSRHRRSLRPTENSAAHCMPPLMPGRITTSTPAKPTTIAVQRRQPTHSPSTGPARIATRNGVANRIASASSSCR